MKTRLIDAEKFERRCMFDPDIEDMQDVIYALRDYPSTIEIPDNATNGDVIKALFPNEGDFETDFDTNWWNAPYKKEDDEDE